MNKNTYLNVIMTLFFIFALAMSVVVVTAIDRHRYALEELTRTVKRMESKISSVRSGAGSPDSSDLRMEKSGVPAANAEYFDPKAVEGGRLITAFGADVGNMNMLINNDAYVSQVWGKVTDSLAERNFKDKGEGNFEPLLAESWSMSPDRRRIRVKLRKGVLWHDFKDPVTGKEWKNREVTAHDVKFYADVIKNPEVDCAPLRVYYKDLESVNLLGDYEFEAVWSRPYFLIEDMTLSLLPLPRHLYHAYEGPFDGKKFNDDHARNRMLVGCGPYRFEKWEKGKRILLRRFENYYGRQLGIMPPIETVAFDIIQHPNTRLQALLSKELDMDNLTPDQWVNRTSSPEFGKDGFLKKYAYPGSAYNYIGLNLKNPVFQDRRVRQALSHLVNREKILKEIFFDLATPVSGPFPKQSAAYDPSILPYSFDVKKASALLAEAGWKDTDNDGVLEKDGRKLRFTVVFPNTGVTYQKMLPVIKEDMKKAGVQMELLGIEWSVLVQRLEKKQFDACALGWTGTLKPDPYQLWYSSEAEQAASSNHIGFVNKQADELIDRIRVCFDPAERTKLYHAFHRLIHEEEPYLFLFSPFNLTVIHSRYNNVRLFHGGIPQSILWVDADRQLPIP